MIVGSLPVDANVRMRARPQSDTLSDLLAPDEHGGCPVDDAARIAARMNVLDCFYVRIALQRDRIEAGVLALSGECRFEFRQILERRAWPRMLIPAQHHLS